jgi:hypothetical protein
VQGYHVKLTVTRMDSEVLAADSKPKVFWVLGCEVPKPSGGY